MEQNKIFGDNKDEQTKKPMTFEQACNFLDSINKVNKKEEAKKTDFPISVTTKEDMQKFLNYAVSLIDRNKYPAHKKFLEWRVAGCTMQGIANHFKVDRSAVFRLEKEALKIAMDVIRIKRETEIPIFQPLN